MAKKDLDGNNNAVERGSCVRRWWPAKSAAAASSKTPWAWATLASLMRNRRPAGPGLDRHHQSHADRRVGQPQNLRLSSQAGEISGTVNSYIRRKHWDRSTFDRCSKRSSECLPAAAEHDSTVLDPTRLPSTLRLRPKGARRGLRLSPEGTRRSPTEGSSSKSAGAAVRARGGCATIAVLPLGPLRSLWFESSTIAAPVICLIVGQAKCHNAAEAGNLSDGTGDFAGFIAAKLEQFYDMIMAQGDLCLGGKQQRTRRCYKMLQSVNPVRHTVQRN